MLSTIRRKLHVLSSTIIASGFLVQITAIMISPAEADDFIIDIAVTTQNGGNVIDGNDSLTITSTGSIATSAITPIDAGGDNNVITNNGLIYNTGIGSRSIRIRSNNTVTNNGSIIGEDAVGIDTRDSNKITNNGLISISGFGRQGIFVDDHNTIINSGTINTTKDSSVGVELELFNTFTNSGHINTKGVNSVGVLALMGNTILNSGSIIANQSDSFYFRYDNNSLNLLAPSFIGGVFNLAGDTANSSTVNIRTGPSHSFHWNFTPTHLVGSAPQLSGLVPVFQRVNGVVLHEVATFDPTILKASHDALAQLSGTLSSIMQQRLEINGNSSSLQTLGTSLQSYVLTKGQNTEKRINRTFDKASSPYNNMPAPAVWLSLFGSRSEHEGTNTTLEYDIGQWGATIGYEWSPTNDMKFGILGGYMQGNLDAASRFANSYSLDTSGFFTGAYGRIETGSLFVDFAVTGGFSDNQQQRMVNNNLAPLGKDFANSTYSSAWLSPELAVGVHHDLLNGWIANPTARIRYASQWIDGYIETSSLNSNAIVASQQIALGEASIEWAATKTTEQHTSTLRVGYTYRTSFGDDMTTVTLIGQTKNLTHFNDDKNIAYVAGNSIVHLNSNLNLQFGTRLEIGEDLFGVQGDVKLVARF